MPIGTLTNSTQRHDSHEVSMPPASRPMAAPDPDTAANTPNARLRSGPSLKLVVISASAVGEAIAPPTPCRARAASSQPDEVARPPSSEARVNSRMPEMNTRRRPRMSPARPPSSSSPPKVSVYALSTHDRLVVEKFSASRMCGRAMFTMVASRTTMSCDAAMTASASPG
jgi:hypothetical protein